MSALDVLSDPALSPLERIRELKKIEDMIQEAIDDNVRLARESGLTWPPIGAALGVTPASANSRYQSILFRDRQRKRRRLKAESR